MSACGLGLKTWDSLGKTIRIVFESLWGSGILLKVHVSLEVNKCFSVGKRSDEKSRTFKKVSVSPGSGSIFKSSRMRGKCSGRS
jgi:hypothetical protein